MSEVSKLCDVCGVNRDLFSNKDGFREHEKKHEDLIHLCPHCGKKFKTVRILKDHLKRLHGGEVKYPCCDKKFNDKFDMEKHRKKKEENLCDLCDKKFTNKFSFKRHMNDHFLDNIYECPTCQKQFKSSSYFEKHVKHTKNILVQYAEKYLV